MKQITMEYYGMEGTGRTVKEAKAEASRKLQAAMEGSYAPKLFSHGDYTMLFYRTPNGYCSSLIHDDEGMRTDPNFSSIGRGDMSEELYRAIQHVVTLGMDIHNTYTVDDLPKYAREKQLAADILSYASWQRAAYHAKRVLGLDSNETHAWACNHSQEFRTRKDVAYASHD